MTTIHTHFTNKRNTWEKDEDGKSRDRSVIDGKFNKLNFRALWRKWLVGMRLTGRWMIPKGLLFAPKLTISRCFLHLGVLCLLPGFADSTWSLLWNNKCWLLFFPSLPRFSWNHGKALPAKRIGLKSRYVIYYNFVLIFDLVSQSYIKEACNEGDQVEPKWKRNRDKGGLGDRSRIPRIKIRIGWRPFPFNLHQLLRECDVD